METLNRALLLQRSAGLTLCPDPKDIFSAFRKTPLKCVRVVIVGQDPYPEQDPASGRLRATGLSFSSPDEIRRPYSLGRILRRIEADIGVPPTTGSNDLSDWARQGVLLLNAALTTIKGSPGAHRGLGWECFTNRALQLVAERDEQVVFMLWGDDAKKKESLIVETNCAATVLKASHPVSRCFSTCDHFSKANEHLRAWKVDPICWSVPRCTNDCLARPGKCI